MQHILGRRSVPRELEREVVDFLRAERDLGASAQDERLLHQLPRAIQAQVHTLCSPAPVVPLDIAVPCPAQVLP